MKATAPVLLVVAVAIVSPSAGLVFLEPTNDSLENVRQTVIPPVDSVVEKYNDATGSSHYVSCNTTDESYVGVVPKGEEEFEEDLEAMDFERNPVSCLKEQETTNETEEGSFRLVQGDYQLHVIIHDREEPDTTYVYAHWEYRWDTHPIKHYREVDFSSSEGAAMMRELLDEHEVEYSESGHPKDL